jgi:hypothetical protein
MESLLQEQPALGGCYRFRRKKESLSRLLVELLEKNTIPCPDLSEPMSWPPAVEARISALMKKRSEITGKDLNSPEVRKQSKIAKALE